MAIRFLVFLANFFKSSSRYQQTKRFYYELLEDPNSRMKTYFDVVMIGLVMFSVLLLIYEVDTPLTKMEMLFETGIVLVFTVEYLLRGWIYNDSHKIILDYYEKTQYLNSLNKRKIRKIRKILNGR